ncbi:MAG: adenylate kinase [Oscillospiraceae bacterium]|nr:adenylate kinase [Oscillospiraceae bacterium]
MVILIFGASHTGKTNFAQKLLEKYCFPYVSLDHLKMGLIRSKNTELTPEDDDKLTEYLWPIAREMAKTAIENNQNLIIEGCYIPFDWKKDFSPEYLAAMREYCLVMTESYIRRNFRDIQRYSNVIEWRAEGFVDIDALVRENAKNLALCEKYGTNKILIDGFYDVDADIWK